MNIAHRSTAKAAIRSLIREYKVSGFFELVADVLKESIPGRRGRPTLAEQPYHMSFKAISSVLPHVAQLESRELNPEPAAARAAAAESETPLT